MSDAARVMERILRRSSGIGANGGSGYIVSTGGEVGNHTSIFVDDGDASVDGARFFLRQRRQMVGALITTRCANACALSARLRAS